jgi:hypothetical protein
MIEWKEIVLCTLAMRWCKRWKDRRRGLGEKARDPKSCPNCITIIPQCEAMMQMISQMTIITDESKN